MSKKILNEKDCLRSSDLALVTVLSLFYPIEAIDKENLAGRAFFLFRKDSEGFDEVLRKYWSRQLAVEPQAFFSQLKIIKARIFSGE